MDIESKILAVGFVGLLSIGLAFNIFVPQPFSGLLLGIGIVSLVGSFVATVRLM